MLTFHWQNRNWARIWKREREGERERETGYERLHLTPVPFHPPYIHPFYGPTLLINHPPPSKINPLWERIILTKTPFLVVGWWCKPWAIPTAVVGLSIPPSPPPQWPPFKRNIIMCQRNGQPSSEFLRSYMSSVRTSVCPFVCTSVCTYVNVV